LLRAAHHWQRSIAATTGKLDYRYVGKRLPLVVHTASSHKGPLPRACLWRFIAFKWRPYVSTVSSSIKMNIEEKYVILVLLRKKLKEEVKHIFFIDRPLKSRQERGIFYTVFNDTVSSTL
jgi:hypothetical protein